MHFQEITDFLPYYDRVKFRTQKLFPLIPPDKIEWTYRKGKFTIGDIIRNLANIERKMYAEKAQFLPSQYAGCGEDSASGYEATIAYYQQCYQESKAIFFRPNHSTYLLEVQNLCK